MKQGITQAIRTDRVGLADLHEISDLLLRIGLFCFRVVSWSMYPVLWKGDQLTVEPATPAQLQVGDLLLFHDRGHLICHRLVATQETGTGPRLIMKGDAAAGCGEIIQIDQVLGRVVHVTRRWPWVRTSGWAGAQAMRFDRARERLIHLSAQGLQYLQSLRGFRWIMRTLLSRYVVYHLVIPEGRQWFRYHRIDSYSIPEWLKRHQRLHLVAKLAGICVGSLQVTASEQGYWIDDLYVRVRYRGLGIASQLLALAATAAAARGARVLLAWIEPANTVSLDLFTKMGFRKTRGLRDNQVCLRRDL